MWMWKPVCIIAMVGYCAGLQISHEAQEIHNNEDDAADDQPFLLPVVLDNDGPPEYPYSIIQALRNSKHLVMALPEYQHLKNTAREHVKHLLLKNLRETLQNKASGDSDDFYRKLTKMIERSAILKSIEKAKRTPEMFSQELYPIQRGAQQTEAFLDKTLGTIIDSSRPHPVGTSEIETTNDNTNEDKDDDKSVTDFHNSERRSDSTAHQQTKRWWALEQIRKYRIPKSYSYGHHPRRLPKVDPVVYFIGLGK